LFIFGFVRGYSQKVLKADTTIFNKIYKSKIEFSGEYLTPTHFSDKIQTISFHSFFWKPHFKNISLKINIGLSGTYAWGYTSYYKLRLDTVFETDHKTSAFGVGPALQIDYSPIKIKKISINIEASGGLILYSNRFPYGGDIYNFMFRTGPSIAYKINTNYILKIGYRWMHVSNGKGYGKQNPFYEAQGINLGFIIIK
jgi:hypothetical protein